MSEPTTTTKPRTFTQAGYGFDFPGPMSDATKARNAATSARQVRRFLSGRVSRDFGYLEAGDAWKGPGVCPPINAKPWSVKTFAGDALLARVSVTKTTAPAFWSGSAPRYYFSGKDARGRVWHGSSPGPGMFARLILNRGPKKRARPVAKAALRRALVALLDAIEPPRGSGPAALPLAGNLNPFSVSAFTNAARLLNRSRR